MSREKPWARHYQEDWSRRSGDARLPYWLRVAAAAYGSHEDNGHATFKRGELSLILASIDPKSGEIIRYSNLNRAIEDAIAFGWLEPGSFWGCLIVPAHAIKKGQHGHSPTCPIHARRSRPKRPELSIVQEESA